MNFGERLRRIREKQNISRAQLAKKSGISYLQLQNYEEQGSNPTLPLLLKLAEALGIEITDLAYDSNNIERLDEKVQSALVDAKEVLTSDQLEELYTMIISYVSPRKLLNKAS